MTIAKYHICVGKYVLCEVGYSKQKGLFLFVVKWECDCVLHKLVLIKMCVFDATGTGKDYWRMMN